MSDLFTTYEELMPNYLVQKDGLVLPSDSYFVMRKSDVFAPPALHAYAGAINTALEVEKALNRQFFSEDERKRLFNLSETLSTTAISWAKTPISKIPD